MSTDGLRISVVMATCDGEPFLARQLESILAQTRKADEIVIVDDASRDGTVALAESYRSRGNLRIGLNAARLGPIKNFEKALHLSTGDLIFFSDQDDVWLPEKIELMASRAGAGALVYSDAEVIDEDDNLLCASELRDHHGVRPVSGSDFWYFIHGNCVSGHNAMITRELAGLAFPFPGFVMYDQWLALVASITSRVEFIDRPLCRHRIHSRNFINNPRLRAPASGESRRAKLTRRARFEERQGKVKRFIEYLAALDLERPETAAFHAHFARLDEIVFDFPLFFTLIRDLSRYYPQMNWLAALDQAIKFCRGRRGYWLPSFRI